MIIQYIYPIYNMIIIKYIIIYIFFLNFIEKGLHKYKYSIEWIHNQMQDKI